ncbi:peptidoglycan recognition protein family protein [Rhizomonospora bruguierae]|uniref:peptidoglycan recognition protein family protein n=1 Tax=Rhizomonospora bruguierae TaxID=1581705 RepID=UPI001BD0BBE6|nr:peptidoglycan-binding domain-containing protein [Micromonospora sp. NBRC 107566]
MEIITRAQWGARSPAGTVHTTTWASRTGFAVHYSGANKDQTPRAIQDYHIGKGWSDIGYNFLVDTAGRIYEGRGWMAVGAHIAGHNTANIGVCMIGEDKDVTDAAKAAIRWLYDEALRRAGKTLTKRYHSLLAATSCPGARLRAWVIAGMPTPGGTTPVSTPAPTNPTDWTEAIVAQLPTLKRGSKGAAVGRLQGLLHAAGYRGSKIDGDFGPATEKDLKVFQAKKKVQNSVTKAGAGDGQAGRYTWTALLGA